MKISRLREEHIKAIRGWFKGSPGKCPFIGIKLRSCYNPRYAYYACKDLFPHAYNCPCPAYGEEHVTQQAKLAVKLWKKHYQKAKKSMKGD